TDLPGTARSEVISLCDKRLDFCFFIPHQDAAEELRGDPLPNVIGGRFVPSDEEAGWAEWRAEYFEYLLNHPEVVFREPQVVRTFHICTRHEIARATLAAGRIPADFVCPLGLQDCPMRKLLSIAPGQAVQLTRSDRMVSRT